MISNGCGVNLERLITAIDFNNKDLDTVVYQVAKICEDFSRDLVSEGSETDRFLQTMKMKTAGMNFDINILLSFIDSNQKYFETILNT